MITTEVENLTSSIGPTWPPQEASFNRIKGIYNKGFVSSDQELAEIIEAVDEARAAQPDKDRMSVRMFIDNDFLASRADQIGDLGELVIPLHGTKPAFENTSILYIGESDNTRQSDPDELSRCFTNLDSALRYEPISLDSVMAKIASQGYEARTLSQDERMSDPKVQRQVADLYATFGWNYEDVLGLLANTGNIIAVVSKGDDIVSAGIGETSTLTIGLHDLKMAEITEASTRADHQGKGLYTAVSASLIRELVHSGVGLAYGECNGSAPGVLKASQALGRTFAYSYCQESGLPFQGYLPQHVPIEGIPRVTPYNDLFPSYISRDDMIKFING